jgi:AcrR family transcriptional regulator
LDRPSVLAAALRLTAAHGLEALTVRAIADHLAVWPTTVHHHLGDVDAIKDAVADAVAAELPAPERLDHRRWRRELAEFAQGARVVVRRYPGVARRIQQRGPTSHHQVEVIDRIVGGLCAAGFPPRQAALAYGLLLNWIVDVSEIEAYRSQAPAVGAAYRATLLDVASSRGTQLRGLAAAAPSFAAITFDEYFEFGLTVLLDGIARQRGNPTSAGSG